MAAPMRDRDNFDNFNNDDNEWDVGIGDLIIDLDADIEKNMADHSATLDKAERSLKMKIKRTKQAKHEIVRGKEEDGGGGVGGGSADACVGTSVGTATEPECLGPCEPGTSVTLEGIVWHETEGGVLVVNVTWRGKTYVGTLLDCTRHDWAPPRFCDSPADELDARAPKGRAKRHRPNDLANFTETRSSLHSKLRNGQPPKPKPASPQPPQPKRAKRPSDPAPPDPPQPPRPPLSPQLLECPEPNCSKKYKHANGLDYHRSHAHGAPLDADAPPADDDDAPPAASTPPPDPVEAPTPPPDPVKDSTPPPTPPPPAPPEAVPPPPPPPAEPRDSPRPEPDADAERVEPKPPQAKRPRSRKSPAASPPPPERDVRSPAYSDISDDAAPAPEQPDADKPKPPGDKKPEPTPPHAVPPAYQMYQFYGQSPYLVPSAPAQPDKLKDDSPKPPDVKTVADKDLKRDAPPEQQKMVPQHFYPYGYMAPGFAYNLDPGFGPVSVVPEDKSKEPPERDRSKESPEPSKPPTASQSPLVGGVKPKAMDGVKDGKHSNENHQILKESIEMKSQMNPYLYQRQHVQPREDEMRRYYMPFEQTRRKDVAAINLESGGKPQIVQQTQTMKQNQNTSNNSSKLPLVKDIKIEDGLKVPSKEEIKQIKQEGQKPTMETTGPPPPPTSQYYLHPSYMQPPHYGGLPFDPMYRGLNPMLVSGPYGTGPYLHPGPMPRYHAPEDLSRPPPPTKSLDLLQHHPQYYSSHKIHELQERALKSPTPKTPGSGGSPSSGGSGTAPPPLMNTPTKAGGSSSSASPADPALGSKESRSPPPQRHVHTHHHTHVGLGYPIYPAPYGAAVLASQQAAAVTVVNSFPPK